MTWSKSLLGQTPDQPPPPWLAADPEVLGIYAFHGDPRPHLPTLKAAKERVAAADAGGSWHQQQEAVEAYNTLLDRLYPMLMTLPMPLGEDYEIDDGRMLADYVELKKTLANNGYPTIQRLVEDPKTTNIAVVDVLKERSVGSQNVQIAVVETIRGTWKSTQAISTSSMPGYGIQWFRKGERCLVLCSREFISLGAVGRMPLIRHDGVEKVCAFTTPQFWPSFPVEFVHGCTLVEWRPLHAFLLRTSP